jgi:hypothetical protein
MRDLNYINPETKITKIREKNSRTIATKIWENKSIKIWEQKLPKFQNYGNKNLGTKIPKI